MTIFISQFWCGVIATILVEIILFIGLLVAISEYKGDKKNGKGKDSNNKGNE